MEKLLRIEKMYAFIAVDPVDGTEGVCSIMMQGNYMPLVGADMERVDSLKPHAQRIANVSGAEIKLCYFSKRIELEVIKPK